MLRRIIDWLDRAAKATYTIISEMFDEGYELGYTVSRLYGSPSILAAMIAGVVNPLGPVSGIGLLWGSIVAARCRELASSRGYSLCLPAGSRIIWRRGRTAIVRVTPGGCAHALVYTSTCPGFLPGCLALCSTLKAAAEAGYEAAVVDYSTGRVLLLVSPLS